MILKKFPAPRATALLTLGAIALTLSACRGIGPPSWPGVTADGDSVFVAFGAAVYALDIDSGNLRWRFPAESSRGLSFYASPTISDEGLLLVGSYESGVLALNPERGTEVWSYEEIEGEIIGSPVAADGKVLVPTAAGRLYALNADTGRLAWEFPNEGSLNGGFWAAPVVRDGMVIIASLNHNLYSLDLETGRQESAVDLSGASAGTPTLTDELALVGTFAEELHAVDLESARVRWSIPTQGWVWGSPVVDEGVAYFGDMSGRIYAVEVESGRSHWPESELLDGAISAAPALAEGQIYFLTDAGTIFSRDIASNAPNWKDTRPGRLLSDPILVDGKLIVAISDGEILVEALQAESGNSLWVFAPES